MPTPPIAFSGSPLDRASQQRTDPKWIDGHLTNPASRFLPVCDLNVLVRKQAGVSLAWATGDVREFERASTGPVLLGLRDDVAHFAIDVSGLEKPEAALGVEGAAEFAETRGLAATLAGEEAAIVAHARSLVDWHATHVFCPNCSEKTRPVQGGGLRFCGPCQTEHYARTNPVAIMAIEHGDRCLLGRQAGWPPGMYSALAGFIEPGESMEEAVRRETQEEAGIRVGPVRYVASQPWPFPSSLMLGCIGQALDEEVTVDKSELDDARWFPRDTLAAALAGKADGVFVPPPLAIAHHLIRAWVDGG